MQVFREFYPNNDEFVTLECVWKSDKFVLLERMHESKTGSQEGDLKEDASLGALAVKYQSIESFLGGTHFHGLLLVLTPPPSTPPTSSFPLYFLEKSASGVIARSTRLSTTHGANSILVHPYAFRILM
jgi:hypothetical protein